MAMLPDDEKSREVKRFRTKEILLAIVLGAVAVSSITFFTIFLGRLGQVALAALIAMEVFIMAVVYVILVKQMRKGGR